MTYRINPRTHSSIDKIIEVRRKNSGLTYSQEFEKLMKYGMIIDQYKPRFKSKHYKSSEINTAFEKLKDIILHTNMVFGRLATNSRTINITFNTHRIINDYSTKNNVTRNLAAYRYALLGIMYKTVQVTAISSLSSNHHFVKMCAKQPFYSEIQQKRDLYALIFNDFAQTIDLLDNVWDDILAGKYGKFELKSEKPSVQTTELPKPIPKKRLTLRGGSIL